MKIEFGPSKAIREFDCASLIGKRMKMYTIVMDAGGAVARGRYVSVPWDEQVRLFGEDCPCISDWSNEVLGEKGTIIERKITAAYLMEGKNGGRGGWKRSQTYAEHFDESMKERCKRNAIGGLMARLIGPGGDPDRADIVIECGNLTIEGHWYDMTMPEEWYSEWHCEDSRFKFERGFYDDSDEAYKFITDRQHNDMFGERYFPVLVFPLDLNITVDEVMNIAGYAKSHSEKIITDKHLIIGLRCKPYEVGECIENTYEAGGAVARGQVWDWD